MKLTTRYPKLENGGTTRIHHSNNCSPKRLNMEGKIISVAKKRQHLINTYDTTFELNKLSSWREGGHKKGNESPYMLPLITVDL